MKKVEIYAIINAELEWCKNHRATEICDEPYYDGYEDGLRQAKRLIRKAKSYDNRQR